MYNYHPLVVEQNGPKFGPWGKNLLYTEYVWLLRVQYQFQVIRRISDLGGKYLMHTVSFWLLHVSVQGKPEVFRCNSYFSDFQEPFCFGKACSGLCNKYCVYTMYFWLSNVQSHSVVIECIFDTSDFDHFVPQKRLVIERNGPNFGPHEWVLSVYRVRLSKCSRSLWDHSGFFQNFGNLAFRKWLVIERKGKKVLTFGILSIYRVFLTLRCSIIS